MTLQPTPTPTPTARNVFLYWVGPEYSLISLLRKLIYLHATSGKGYNVVLITDKNVQQYVQNIPSCFTKLCPAHQADFVRVNVICDYGGIWLDSDTLVVDSLDELFDFVYASEDKCGFFIKHVNNSIFYNGIFGSRKNTPVMLEWKRRMAEILKCKSEHIHWNEIGSDILDRIDARLYADYDVMRGSDRLFPVSWEQCAVEFIDKPYENYKTIVRDSQPLVALVNSVYKRVGHMTEAEILEGTMPINYFINKSFERAANR